MNRKLIILSTVLSISSFALPLSVCAEGNYEYQENELTQTNGENAVLGATDTCQWVQSINGSWWYKYPDGSYMSDEWGYINNRWYHFDEMGWMETGWIKIGSTWYYLDENGAMETEWVNNEGTWYYLGDNGAMATGWIHTGDTWYYLKNNGAMETGWINDGTDWFYLQDSGAMASDQWVGSYYVGTSGAMLTDTWIGIYYVDSNGAWVQDTANTQGTWEKDLVGWRFKNSSGSYPEYSWQYINDNWYYFGYDGYMVQSRWEGNYYLSSTGEMATDTWILSVSTLPFNRQYYVGTDGAWIPNEVYHGADGVWRQNENGRWFERTDGSYPVSDFECVNDNWYFFDERGYMKTGLMRNTELGRYHYFYEDGIMATDTTIDGYYFDERGSGTEL